MPLHTDTSRPAVAQEASCSTGAELSLFFPHSGRGQSILIRVPPNAWIVVDVNKAASEQNPTREILERYATQPGFQILALIITHFHDDHYSGVADILHFCKKVAEERGAALPEILRRLILPCSYEIFREFLKDQNHDKIKGHLKKLLDLVEEASDLVRTLPAMQYAWKGSNLQGLQAEGIWCFTFYPSTDKVIEEFFTDRRNVSDLGARAERTYFLQEGQNRYAYLLGIGCGNCGDLCFLLTSDLPGAILGSVTALLRDRILPDVVARQAGAFWAIEPLLDPEAPPHHLRPVGGLTVPHHGSGRGPARHEDLGWWLGSWKQREQPTFAIIQGGPQALRGNTVEELAKARLRIFATSRPENLDGNETCRDLDSRLLGRLVPALIVPTHVVPMEDKVDDDGLTDVPCMTIHGGSGGMHRVIAQRLYEIIPSPMTILFHERTQIYPVCGAAGRS